MRLVDRRTDGARTREGRMRRYLKDLKNGNDYVIAYLVLGLLKVEIDEVVVGEVCVGEHEADAVGGCGGCIAVEGEFGHDERLNEKSAVEFMAVDKIGLDENFLRV